MSGPLGQQPECWTQPWEERLARHLEGGSTLDLAGRYWLQGHFCHWIFVFQFSSRKQDSSALPQTLLSSQTLMSYCWNRRHHPRKILLTLITPAALPLSSSSSWSSVLVDSKSSDSPSESEQKGFSFLFY